MSGQAYHALEVRPWLEHVLFQLGDVYEIRIVWDCDTAVLTSVLAVVGSVIGGYNGGRLGAALGAGIGGAAGLGVSTVISLREAWSKIKDQLQGVLYIIYNYLRSLDPVDYIRAFRFVMANENRRLELVMAILEFIAKKLGREVFSNLSSAAVLQ